MYVCRWSLCQNPDAGGPRKESEAATPCPQSICGCSAAALVPEDTRVPLVERTGKGLARVVHLPSCSQRCQDTLRAEALCFASIKPPAAPGSPAVCQHEAHTGAAADGGILVSALSLWKWLRAITIVVPMSPRSSMGTMARTKPNTAGTKRSDRQRCEPIGHCTNLVEITQTHHPFPAQITPRDSMCIHHLPLWPPLPKRRDTLPGPP